MLTLKRNNRHCGTFPTLNASIFLLSIAMHFCEMLGNCNCAFSGEVGGDEVHGIMVEHNDREKRGSYCCKRLANQCFRNILDLLLFQTNTGDVISGVCICFFSHSSSTSFPK
jgi:hypothetical protein